ncbi:hypothetical protein PM082_020281 [Marasmius tenuissimus]|nr:hypothetical protein PM082_020281 [Marasmius tenuissimus]
MKPGQIFPTTSSSLFASGNAFHSSPLFRTVYWISYGMASPVLTSTVLLAAFVCKYDRLDKGDSILLVQFDQQIEVFETVRDYDPVEFRSNVLAHAARGKLFDLPTILTISSDDGTTQWTRVKRSHGFASQYTPDQMRRQGKCMGERELSCCS